MSTVSRRGFVARLTAIGAAVALAGIKVKSFVTGRKALPVTGGCYYLQDLTVEWGYDAQQRLWMQLEGPLSHDLRWGPTAYKSPPKLSRLGKRLYPHQEPDRKALRTILARAWSHEETKGDALDIVLRSLPTVEQAQRANLLPLHRAIA